MSIHLPSTIYSKFCLLRQRNERCTSSATGSLDRVGHPTPANPSSLTIRSLPTSPSAHFTIYFLTLVTYPPGISACSSLPVHLLPAPCFASSIGDKGHLTLTITPTSSVSSSGYNSNLATFLQSVRNSTITSNSSVLLSGYESNPDAFEHSVQSRCHFPKTTRTTFTLPV